MNEESDKGCFPVIIFFLVVGLFLWLTFYKIPKETDVGKIRITGFPHEQHEWKIIGKSGEQITIENETGVTIKINDSAFWWHTSAQQQ